MIALYMNCKQNEHDKHDIKKLNRIINKLCPTDPETNYKHKKKRIITLIDKEKLHMPN